MVRLAGKVCLGGNECRSCTLVRTEVDRDCDPCGQHMGRVSCCYSTNYFRLCRIECSTKAGGCALRRASVRARKKSNPAWASSCEWKVLLLLSKSIAVSLPPGAFLVRISEVPGPAQMMQYSEFGIFHLKPV